MDGDETRMGDAQAIIEQCRASAQPAAFKARDESDPDFILYPDGTKALDLREYNERLRPAPRRTVANVELHTLESLIDYTERHSWDVTNEPENGSMHKRERVTPFCTLSTSPELTVIFDNDTHGAAGWRAHRAWYAFPLSLAWQQWVAIQGKSLSVAEFARFLEGRVDEVVNPGAIGDSVKLPFGMEAATQTQLLQLARGLSLRVDTQFEETRDRDTGNSSLVQRVENRDPTGNPLKVPNGFVIGVAPFEGAARFAVVVRLQFSTSGGKLAWSLTLHKPEERLREAVMEACAEFERRSFFKVLYGAPPQPR